MTPKSAPSGLTPLTVSAGDTISTKQYQVSTFSLSSSQMVRITGQVTLNVTQQFLMTGSSQLIIEAGASLMLYVSGEFKVTGSGIINQSTQPKNCQIYGASSCTLATYTGSSAFYGTIYAPKAAATISGSSGIFGSIRADSIRFTGGGIHYDESLEGQGGNISGLKLNSWRWI
jgi:hypothetical protein